MVTCSDYIFFIRSYLHRNVTERKFLAKSERRKDKDHQQCFFCLLFFVFFHGRFEQDQNDPNNTSYLTGYTLAPPPCRKPCAMTIYLEQTFEYI